jgi:hypothetical protein
VEKKDIRHTQQGIVKLGKAEERILEDGKGPIRLG